MSIHDLLTPQNCTLVLIDHQPQMLFGVASMDRQLLINNAVGLAKAAKVFDVPVILTSVETKSFSGYIVPQITEQFPDQAPIERTSMNSWEDPGFRAEVERIGRKKLVIAALWTEVCLCYPAIEAIRDGYEVYAVADASGGTTITAHDMAMQRMIQAGVVPVTWQQVLLEWQRDWARKETYYPTLDVVKAHSGAYGTGVEYAFTMVHGQPPSVPTPEPIRLG
ncbi:hydrolase [Oscillatoria sp. FACHB-1407]|uniref:hydrolase n=1 Tax=Oscillatoria sp. FACHB-1407 TaxID=2692847 RepID=UPI001686695C|nr:hydrolase [Oscillatoria sp. FACHB-1407]MBD2463078.1 hydrolase [Oscillatoria sp. FACHB-1407]